MTAKSVFAVFVIFILLEWFVIARSAHARVTQHEAEQVYYRLCSHIVLCPKFQIYKDNLTENSFASVKGVFVSVSMLSLVANKDEIAHIMGHELGHISKGDIYVDSDKLTQKQSYAMEYRADMFGAQLMSKAGFNRCRGIHWLKTMTKKYGDPPGIDHPRGTDRYRGLSYGCPK